jgi:hypothetical protein
MQNKTVFLQSSFPLSCQFNKMTHLMLFDLHHVVVTQQIDSMSKIEFLFSLLPTH